MTLLVHAIPDGVPAHAAGPIAQHADGTRWSHLPRRDLDQSELLRLAATVARSPELWRDAVEFGSRNGDQRHYVSLYRDSYVDVWMLCWTPADDTGWHDHDVSSGAVAVVQGCLVEHNLALGRASIATEVPAGMIFSFGPDHIHRLTGVGHPSIVGGSVSVHAYSPPLWRMGQYAVGPTGMLRRTSVSYADELRPLDEVDAG